MGRSRRGRRRLERARAKQPSRSRSFSPLARVGLVAGGVILIALGVLLLLGGTSQSETRLARVAGILIIFGLLGLGLGAIGRI